MTEIATEHYSDDLRESATTLTNICHRIASDAGWWDDPDKRNVPTLLMLTVSELAEAMEGDRKNLMDDHLPHRKAFEVELADALIRIFDMAGGLGIDVAGALAEKAIYNMHRADHKKATREAAGGKQY